MQVGSIGSGDVGSSITQMTAQLHLKLFQSIDSNGDGKIDPAELATFAQKTGLNADSLMKQYDKDGDGALNPAEAKAMFQDTLKTPGIHYYLNNSPKSGTTSREVTANELAVFLNTSDTSGNTSSLDSLLLTNTPAAEPSLLDPLLNPDGANTYGPNGIIGTSATSTLNVWC